MTDGDSDGDAVNWPDILKRLRAGETVDVPCQAEKDYIRRGQQAVKRAETRGLAIEVTRYEGFLRLVPSVQGGRRGAGPDDAGDRAAREARRAERARRRDDVRG